MSKAPIDENAMLVRVNAWRWAPLEPVRDADDAHDVLITAVPILHGVLHHDSTCRKVGLDHGSLGLFCAVVSTPPGKLEIPLKVMALHAISHILSASTLPPNHLLSLLSNYVAFLDVFAGFRGECAVLDSQNAAEAELLGEACEALYVASQQMVLAVRASASECESPFASANLLMAVVQDALVVPSACSLLMLVLQSEMDRQALLANEQIKSSVVQLLRTLASDELAAQRVSTPGTSSRDIQLQAQYYLATLDGA